MLTPTSESNTSSYILAPTKTIEDWMEILCKDLNNETSGTTVRYKMRRVFQSPAKCHLVVSRGRINYPIALSVGFPRHRGHKGAIASVRMTAAALQTRKFVHLDRPFRVSTEGTVDVSEIHSRVQKILGSTKGVLHPKCAF